MVDSEKREPGKYVRTFEIEQDNVTYIVTETTVVGRDNVVLNFMNEYNPPLPYVQ